MRSMRSTPTGGRPLPAFGYTGSIRAHSSRHGTTRSISAKNCARRVVFVYFSKPVPARVICLRAIITSRGRPLPAHHSTSDSNARELFRDSLDEVLALHQRTIEPL